MAGTGFPIRERAATLLQAPPVVAPNPGTAGRVGAALQQTGAALGSLADDAWAVADARAQAEYRLRARVQRDELMRANIDQPEQFKAAWQGVTAGTVEAADMRHAGMVQRLFDEAGAEAYSELANRALSRQRGLAKDSFDALFDKASSDALAAAGRGGLDQPPFQTAIRDASDALQAGVAHGFWSPERADFLLGELKGKAAGERLIGALRDIYDAGGLSAAQAEIERFRTTPDIALPPVERERIIGRGEARLREWEGGRSADLTLLRGQAAEVRKAFETGTAAERDVARVADGLAALGDVRGAAALRQGYQRQEILADWATFSPDEHERRLNALRASGSPLAARIVRAERGGDPTAQAPTSSAAGAGQFIKGTWLRLIKGNAPDLAKGKSDAELLALRSDPVLSRRMVDAYAAENRTELAAAGLPTDDGALYLAHFAGAAGAKAVLSADPQTPVKDLLSADAVKANSFLSGMTAGDLRKWATDKVAGGGPDPELLKDLDQQLRAKREALGSDPLGWAARQRGAPDLAPVNWSDAAGSTAALQQRQRLALQTEAVYGTGAAPVFTKTEIDTLKGVYDDADAAGKTRIVGTLAGALDERHLAATLDRLGEDRPALLVAGSLWKSNREVAASVLRGDAARKAEKTLVPKADQTLLTAVNDFFGQALAALPQQRAQAVDAAMARYADLSVAAGDYAGVLDERRLTQALADVTGGTVRWNGALVIAPKSGMTDSGMADLMRGLGDADYAGAVTPSGRAVTARDVARLGRLVDRGAGRYSIVLNGETPVLGRDGRPFVLDLAGRAVASAVGAAVGAAVAPPATPVPALDATMGVGP